MRYNLGLTYRANKIMAIYMCITYRGSLTICNEGTDHRINRTSYRIYLIYRE